MIGLLGLTRHCLYLVMLSELYRWLLHCFLTNQSEDGAKCSSDRSVYYHSVWFCNILGCSLMTVFMLLLTHTRYGMRYVAMSLRVALAEKFPESPESEILKVKYTDINVCSVCFRCAFRYLQCVYPSPLSWITCCDVYKTNCTQLEQLTSVVF